MIYNGYFINRDNEEYRVELQTPSGTSSKEIKLSTDPFIVTYEGEDDIFKPLKLSGATVRCWVDDYMFDLYSGKAKGTKCTLYKGDKIEWMGYLTPNIYNQDYMQYKFELELEAVDGLSILEHVPYYTADTTLISFLDIIKKAINSTGLNFKNLNVLNSYDINLEDLHISEENFFSEEGEAMSYKEVLEEMLKYLGCDMFQYQDNIYIVDLKKLQRKNESFRVYNLITNAITEEIQSNSVDFTDKIIYAGASISLSEVFNKVSVVANGYKIDNLVYDVTSDRYTYETGTPFSGQVDTTKYSGVTCTNTQVKLNPDIPEFDNANFIGQKVGFLRGASWYQSDPAKYKADWQTYLAIKNNKSATSVKVAEVSSNKYVFFEKGYLVFDCSWYLQNYNCPFPRDNANSKAGNENLGKLRIRLKVGDKYHTGSYSDRGCWTNTPTFIDIDMKDKSGDIKFINSWLSVAESGYYGREKKSGLWCRIPGEISGKVSLEIWTYSSLDFIEWQFFKDIKLEYSQEINPTLIGKVPISEYNDLDTEYTNIIDSNNVSTLSDINLKINTKNLRMLSNSYVITKYLDSYNNPYLSFLNKTTKTYETGEYKPEEFIVNNYYQQYKQPRKVIEFLAKGEIKLTDDLIIDDKHYIVNSINYNYADNTCETKITELYD